MNKLATACLGIALLSSGCVRAQRFRRCSISRVFRRPHRIRFPA